MNKVIKIVCGIFVCAFPFLVGEAARQLTPLSPFNWSEILDIPTVLGGGQQIFHFSTSYRPYLNDPEAVKFVETYLASATVYECDAEVLKEGSDMVALDGAYIELGVSTGRSINFIAGLNPKKIIYGFDSFKGIPFEWDQRGKVFPAGSFAYKDESFVPPVLKNVVLYKGWFSEVLPLFKAQILKKSPIAFMHVDCDIYESTRDAFTVLGDCIVPGTVIVFDELYNYAGYELHEWKAFQEFLVAHSLKAEFLAYNKLHQQVAVRVVK